MGMHVSHRVQSEVSQKNNLQPVACGYTTVHPRLVQMEGGRDTRRSYDARPCTSFVEYSAEVLRLQLYGILEREIGNDDI